MDTPTRKGVYHGSEGNEKADVFTISDSDDDSRSSTSTLIDDSYDTTSFPRNIDLPNDAGPAKNPSDSTSRDSSKNHGCTEKSSASQECPSFDDVICTSIDCESLNHRHTFFTRSTFYDTSDKTDNEASTSYENNRNVIDISDHSDDNSGVCSDDAATDCEIEYSEQAEQLTISEDFIRENSEKDSNIIDISDNDSESDSSKEKTNYYNKSSLHGLENFVRGGNLSKNTLSKTDAKINMIWVDKNVVNKPQYHVNHSPMVNGLPTLNVNGTLMNIIRVPMSDDGQIPMKGTSSLNRCFRTLNVDPVAISGVDQPIVDVDREPIDVECGHKTGNDEPTNARNRVKLINIEPGKDHDKANRVGSQQMKSGKDELVKFNILREKIIKILNTNSGQSNVKSQPPYKEQNKRIPESVKFDTVLDKIKCLLETNSERIEHDARKYQIHHTKSIESHRKLTNSGIDKIINDQKPMIANPKLVIVYPKSTIVNPKPITAKHKPISAHSKSIVNSESLFANLKPIIGNPKPLFSDPKSIFDTLQPIIANLKPSLPDPEPVIGNSKQNIDISKPLVGNKPPHRSTIWRRSRYKSSPQLIIGNSKQNIDISTPLVGNKPASRSTKWRRSRRKPSPEPKIKNSSQINLNEPNSRKKLMIELVRLPMDCNTRPILKKTTTQSIKAVTQPTASDKDQPIIVSDRFNHGVKSIKTDDESTTDDDEPINDDDEPIERGIKPINVNDQPIVEVFNRGAKSIKTNHEPISDDDDSTDTEPINVDDQPIDGDFRSFNDAVDLDGDLAVKMRTFIPRNKHTKTVNLKIVRCDVCDLNFTDADGLKEHNTKSHNICEFCNKQLDTTQLLYEHFKSAHPDDYRFAYKCPICDKKYLQTDGLNVHMLNVHTVDRPFKCEQCGNGYALKKLLKAHVKKVHMRPLKCGTCGKGFVCQSALKNHMSYHSDPTVMCNYCGKLYHNKPALKLHIASMHTGTRVVKPKQPVDCVPCVMTFKSKKIYKEHILRVHLNIREFHCDVCGKDFVSRRILARHKYNSHSGKRKKIKKHTVCTICNATVQNMSIHMKIHGEKRFTCDLCGKQFVTKHHIKQHMSMTHSEETSHC